MAYVAVGFDLLTALLDTWSLWSSVAGDRDLGMRWHGASQARLRGKRYRPFEDIVRESATEVGLDAKRASLLLRRWGEFEPWPDVPPVLERLDGTRRFVVTNCSRKLGRLAAFRAGRFELVVTAEEAGAYKPDPLPYRMALERLGLDPAEGLFVGGAGHDVRPGYTRVFDLPRFLMEQGRRFERAVLVDLQQRWPVTRIATRPDEARSLAAAEATWDAMKNGAPLIASGVLRDPERRTYGVADLLVRSDVLAELCPDAFIGDQLELPVAAMRHGRHYRVVDIKFSTLPLLKDRGPAGDSLAVMTQAWIYNEALGRIQGFTPPAAYVAGRAWRQGASRGDRCWEKLARVPREAFVRSQDEDLGAVVARAIGWIRRLRTEGAEWRVLPIPSEPELWPNMKASSVFPWHTSKTETAAKLGELPMPPRLNPGLRAPPHPIA